MDNRQWTEQECEASAVICGYTDAEVKLYFLHYDCQDWKRANGQAITKLQTHMQWCKATGNIPALREKKEGGSIKKLQTSFGGKFRQCGAQIKIENPKRFSPTTHTCGMPARWLGGGAYPKPYCLDCIPKVTRDQLISQGYTRDDGTEL